MYHVKSNTIWAMGRQTKSMHIQNYSSTNKKIAQIQSQSSSNIQIHV